MRDRAWTVGVVAAAALAACGSERDRKADAMLKPTGHVEGQIVRKDGRSIFVRPAGQPEVEVRTPDGVVVNYGEVGLPAGALRVGTDVRAAYATKDGANLATVIDVEKEGGAYMLIGSETYRGLAPDEGAARPAHHVPPPWTGPVSGPSASVDGGARSGGPAGGGIHGPERVPIAPEPGTGTGKRDEQGAPPQPSPERTR